ncbi:MAG: dihydrodipicolinate synthase family protein [Caldicoprobacterales bacterium]|jgi:N-acetylneuraminate lyase
MKFEGIMPAFITPLSSDNVTVNESAARKLVEHELSLGADGFYICGATGEGLVMQKEERKRLCEIVIDQVKGRKPVISHIAAMDLTTSIELARHAEKAGVDCVASIPPFYFKYDNKDIINYYKELDKAVNIPIMVYYHPAAKADMKAELIADIFKLEHVTAVKWSSNNYYEMLRLKDMTHGEMNVINGPDEMLICGLAAGADGGIGSTYNVMTAEYKKLYGYFRLGNIEEARRMQYKVNRVTSVITSYNTIPVIKLALQHLGFEVGDATYPMPKYSPEERKQIIKNLEEAGWPENFVTEAD